MGVVKTIDMRTHGTQKTMTKAMCSHKTKTQAHGLQNKSLAMCKTGHEHAANENTHKPRVHTRHDNIKARSQNNTQAAFHTAQDITLMHTADKNTNCVQHKSQHTWTEECAAERTQDCTLTQQDRTWSASVQTPSRNRNSRHECRELNTTLQHETRHTDERVHGSNTLEATHSHKNGT